MEQVAHKLLSEKGQVAGFASATGSAGTIAAGDYLKQKFPGMKIIASEALQCPTLLNNGFGAHRIEGIGDKQHSPRIHNVKNTDFITAIDDNAVNLARLFNEPEGKQHLIDSGFDQTSSTSLICLASPALPKAIKFAKYNELTENDIVLNAVLTD